MTHEKPIMVRDENFYIQQQSSDNTHEVKDMLPKFVGVPCRTTMLTGKGMPKHITNAESAVLFQVIKQIPHSYCRNLYKHVNLWL